MTHPLTDDIIESELATPTHFISGSLVGMFTHDDMRAVADWQLEQVVSHLENYNDPIWHALLKDELQTLINDLKKAMRPQEDTP